MYLNVEFHNVACDYCRLPFKQGENAIATNFDGKLDKIVIVHRQNCFSNWLTKYKDKVKGGGTHVAGKSTGTL